MTILNFINNQHQPSVSGLTLENIEPATGQPLGSIPKSSQADVEAAVLAAEKAFPIWSNFTPEKRFEVLNKIADGIQARFEEFALAESRDSGKPLSVTRAVDIPRAIQNFRFFATGAIHFSSESHYSEAGAINYTLRRPIGVVGCISPWNLPLYLFSWKIAPALAVGCCVVGKPSEVTPLTAFLLTEVCLEAGLPAGVLNVLHGLGPEVGAAIVAHPKIKAVSFTGSTRAGEEIAKVAAPMFKKLSLELGGKNPVIVFKDCDLEEALDTTVRSSFANQGQICLCGSRILIEREVYEKFKAGLKQRAEGLVAGNPSNPSTQFGALVSELHRNKVLGCIELAKQEGGILVTGGNAFQPEGECRNGFFILPTIIEGLPQQCRTNREEIFGPVVTIMPFDSEEEAISMANDTDYGLAAVIWSKDIQRTQRVALALESGIVWVNTWMMRDLRTPFGGVKSSGVGREGGWEAFRFFTEVKNVCVKL